MACDTTALPVELARELGFESAAQSDGHAMFRRAERESKQFDAVIDTVGAQ